MSAALNRVTLDRTFVPVDAVTGPIRNDDVAVPDFERLCDQR